MTSVGGGAEACPPPPQDPPLCAPPCTPQVAFGLLQFVTSVGGGADGVNTPIGLNPLLRQYDLP